MSKQRKLKAKTVYYYIIVLAFGVSSYAALLPTFYLDDVIVLLLGGVEALRMLKGQSKLNTTTVLVMVLLLSEGVFFAISFLTVGNPEVVFSSFLSLIKVIILIICCFEYQSSLEERINAQKLFFIISIPNIIRGIYEYYVAYIVGSYIAGGKYEYGVGFRVQGYVGHPIYYSLLMVMCVMYLLYFAKSKFRFIMVGVCSFLCVYTWTTFSVVLLVGLCVNFIFQKLRVHKFLMKFMKPLLVLMIIGAAVAMIWYMQFESYTLRSMSFVTTMENLSFVNFFVGEGFGTYTVAGLGEAYLFHILYENGLMGIVLLSAPLVKIIKNQLVQKNYEGMFFIFSFIANIIINEGYLIPYIFYMPILCGIEVKKNVKNL